MSTDVAVFEEPPVRRCSKCGDTFPATPEFFFRNKNIKDGLHLWCKGCIKEYHKRPEIREHRHAYRGLPDVREKENSYARERAARPEIKKRKHVTDKALHSQPQYKASRRSPEYRKINRVYGATRRARERSIQGTHTPAQIQEQLKRQKYRCYYVACGHAKFEKRNGQYIYHVDHTFPLSRVAGSDIPANDISYLVLACPSCNYKKSDKLPHEFYEGGKLL